MLFSEIYVYIFIHFLIKSLFFSFLPISFESYKIILASIFISPFENNFVYIYKNFSWDFHG